jgi:two-component system, NarL family, nitrate/nitrite response regulator NarL
MITDALWQLHFKKDVYRIVRYRISDIAMGYLRKGSISGVQGDLAGYAEGASAEGRAPRRILIVSDIRILREGLAEVLARDSSFFTVGIVSSLEEALEVVAVQPVQMALIDAALPEGTNAVTRLRELSLEVQIIVFALSETEDTVISWAEAGACGYVPRSAALDDLIDLINGILKGEQICSKRVAAGQLRPGHDSGLEPQPVLTAREAEIVRCLGAGLSNKEIARRLNIGLATTKTHVHNILNKLMLQRRGQVSTWVRANASVLASVSDWLRRPANHPDLASNAAQYRPPFHDMASPRFPPRD